jgi:hypothetical protein
MRLEACILFNSLTPMPKLLGHDLAFGLVETMIVDQLEDQLLLALGAVPAIGLSPVAIAIVAGMTIAIHRGGCLVAAVRVDRVHAVPVGRNESGILHLFIDALWSSE